MSGLIGTATELLNQVFGVNQANNKSFLIVDNKHSESSYTNEFSSSQSSNSIISPASGNKIEVHSVLIHTSGSVGEIDVDFSSDDGNKIAKVYSSQNTRVVSNGMSVEGNVDEDVEVDGGGDSFFVAIAYSEEEG